MCPLQGCFSGFGKKFWRRDYIADHVESQNGSHENWWPRMVMHEVLKQYYLATGDERVIELMKN
ncbi:MAG: hypothetical protein KC944_16685 [Candidatus Omnitrophica bacterium]|nr:hypothetical protein [Candidatus Omnitrophota bacterium]